ncbi:MAG: phosphomannomutase/phosphoglucomutase [Nitrospirae bacterium]|nr:phosphomannomutase/phosphoglucomutase [Nitrospirota bacterium]MBF0540584.1 phosphomannomutase/phosphoglucomutase [Nitrospirota bacterium]
MFINEKIFRKYDIRGIVGTDLTRELTVALGRAFAIYLKEIKPNAKAVSIGRDVRESSPMFAEGLAEGITGEGITVYNLGACPTPHQYFSIHHLNLDGGIMVTGSHNSTEFNGFKISVGKGTIHGEAIQKIKEIILRALPSNSRKGTRPFEPIIKDILSPYKNFMLEKFAYLNDKKYSRLKIVIDAGNGVGGLAAPQILENIGCEVIPLYCEPDGRFPNHHPDPTVIENIADLIKTVKDTNADIGIGYDGDADRIGVVDSDGSIIWGDQLMIILSRSILKKKNGATIIGDVKCSQILFDEIKTLGGTGIMWKTGHSLIKEKMKETGAILAGEFSGHIFIADEYFGYDDAIYTTIRLIEIMKTTGLNIKELLSGIPQLFYTPEIRIDCPDDKKSDVIKNMSSAFKDFQTCDIDGIRVIFEKGWGLIRASNTQPAIIMRVEASDEESLNQYREIILRALPSNTRKGSKTL